MSAAKRRSDVPVMQPADSMSDLFNGALLDSSVSDQMSLINFDETDYDLVGALAEWGTNMALPNFDSSQSTPISSQETSHSPFVVLDSSQSSDEGSICYGMVSDHRICLSDLSDLGHDSPAIVAQR